MNIGWSFIGMKLLRLLQKEHMMAKGAATTSDGTIIGYVRM